MAHTPTPWGLCHHLKSPEHDASCQCGYRGAIWGADGEYIVVEMGSSPDVDINGAVQGHTQPQADRATQLDDAAFIVECVNSHAALVEDNRRLREALEKVIAYDGLLRSYEGPSDTLFAGDVAEIDAAYDEMIASSRSALAKGDGE